jgi:hypothetical protein
VRLVKLRQLSQVGTASFVGQRVELLEKCGMLFRTVGKHPRNSADNRVSGFAALAAQDATLDFVRTRRGVGFEDLQVEPRGATSRAYQNVQ